MRATLKLNDGAMIAFGIAINHLKITILIIALIS